MTKNTMSFLKDITIENVISFVVKAMANDLNVSADKIRIEVFDRTLERFAEFIFDSEYTLSVRTMKGRFTVEMDEAAYHKFLILCDSVNQYVEEKGIEEFNNFFKEDNKPTDINDLDEED